jgi:hypothetical protein
MPESLTRREGAYVNLWGVRLHVGMASGFTSESRPASSRNRVRHRLGISGRHQSESADRRMYKLASNGEIGAP